MKPRLLYLSAYPARDASGGSLLMHRHFSRLAGRYELHRAHHDAPLAGEENYHQLAPRPLYHRLAHTRFTETVKGLDHAYGFFHSRRALVDLIRRVQPDLVVTVAEDSFYVAAAAAARQASVPLVAVFHDWAPGWHEIPEKWQARAERAFRRVYAESAHAFCVSDELRTALGEKSRASVLHPIPDATPPLALEPDPEFHALYAGAFRRLYAAEVKALCGEFARAGTAPGLRVIGPDPAWPAEDQASLVRNGFYRGFHKGEVFQQQLARAPVHLVISPFGRDYESYARYSFPSKIPEYCRFGRPILLWGPAHAASVRWARRTGAAHVVEDPSPAAVVAALRRLHDEPGLRVELGQRALRAATNDFDPDRLQGIFESGIAQALHPERQPVSGNSTCPPLPAN